MFNLVLGLLLAVRFWQLGLKPVHHDESINGWFVIELWKTGNFRYDPSNYHGPLLFYLFQAAEAVGGWGIASFRFVTVLFSVLTVVWLWRWTEERLQLSGWWLCGLCLSPGFLFFSRSAIHESLLIFFLVLAATAWIDVWCLRRPKAIPLFLYGLTGMLLVKETFVIPVALAVLCSLPYMLRKDRWTGVAAEKSRLVFHAFVCVLIWAAFFSSFGGNPRGLLDFFHAFLPWAKTGTQGNGHEKEFWYFFKLFWSYEPATVLALLLCGLGLIRSHWVRWVSLWAIANLLVYSWIPYKTPWCLLSVQAPLWFAAALVMAKTNFVVRFTGQLGLVVLGLVSIPSFTRLNFHTLPESHPYVYVQTTETTKVFVESLLRQGNEHPSRWQAHVLLATEEPWPFPWWLAKYSAQASTSLEAGFTPDTALLLVDEPREADAEAKLQGAFWKARFPVRDARVPAIAYLKKEIFDCPMPSCEEVSR